MFISIVNAIIGGLFSLEKLSDKGKQRNGMPTSAGYMPFWWRR